MILEVASATVGTAKANEAEIATGWTIINLILVAGFACLVTLLVRMAEKMEDPEELRLYWRTRRTLRVALVATITATIAAIVVFVFELGAVQIVGDLELIIAGVATAIATFLPVPERPVVLLSQIALRRQCARISLVVLAFIAIVGCFLGVMFLVPWEGLLLVDTLLVDTFVGAFVICVILVSVFAGSTLRTLKTLSAESNSQTTD